jgi:PKD domain-containing protein/Big-like domain-containing protein
MVAHMKRAFLGLALLGVIAAVSLTLACDQVPLVAPTGSVINLFAAATTVPLNGDIEIVANVIENGTAQTPTTTPGAGTGGTTPTTGTTTTTSAGAGTPVQNGTLVSFTTTIGRIEPFEARTNNGQVRVRFLAGSVSGTATITAFSGGASGKIENLKVGAAAVERVILSASPQTLPPGGGTSTISARVEDASGLALSAIPVTFTTDNGSLNPATATTDSTGVATTVLNAPRTAKVTASVAGKTADVTVTLSPRTGISITTPTTQVSAGQPATFTVSVGTTANIQNVTIDFGDGHQQSLGAISGSTTVQHTYTTEGTYNVRATATDASGFTEQVSTSITILPGQPPSVVITASNNNPSVGETVIFTATASGATSTIVRYEWDFGGGIPATASTTGNRATATYTSTGSKVITVRVIQATGPSGDGTTSIVVKP